MKGKPVKLLSMKNKGIGKKPEEFPLQYIAIGIAYAIRGGQKIKLSDAAPAKEGEPAPRLEDGDRIITERGCVLGLTSGNSGDSEDEKERISLSIYPESEARISVQKSTKTESGYTVTRQKIASVELVRGLFSFNVATMGKLENKILLPSGYPQFEFKPLFGEFKTQKSISTYIELGQNGTLTLFTLFGRVLHKPTGIEAGGATAGDVKITLTRDAVYSTNLSKHPDARIEAIRKNEPQLGGAALISGSRGGGAKQKWAAPTVSHAPSRESAISEAREQLKAAEESGDEALIEVAKAQLNSAESYNPDAEKAASEEMAKQAKRRIEKAKADAKQAAERAFSPLPPYSSLSEEDKLVRKDVKRTAKSYEMLIGDISTRQAELSEKYLKGRPSAAQALAYETEMLKARQQLEEGVKATAQVKGLVAQTASSAIGQTLSYRNLDYEVVSAEKGTELGFSRSPQGKEFVLVRLRVSNKTKIDAYLDPDNACSLMAGGEQIASSNYEIKTDIPAGGRQEGFIIFVVPQDAKNFTFQLGMKNEKKLSIGFKM